MSETGTQVLIAIISAAVPTLVGFLCVWLKSLYDNNKSKIKNEKVREVLGQVTDMVTSAVVTTTSTYVKELKAAGSFDKEAQAEAFRRTHDAVMAQLTTDAADILRETYGDIETFLTTKIEQAIEATKK